MSPLNRSEEISIRTQPLKGQSEQRSSHFREERFSHREL